MVLAQKFKRITDYLIAAAIEMLEKQICSTSLTWVTRREWSGRERPKRRRPPAVGALPGLLSAMEATRA